MGLYGRQVCREAGLLLLLLFIEVLRVLHDAQRVRRALHLEFDCLAGGGKKVRAEINRAPDWAVIATRPVRPPARPPGEIVRRWR